MKCEKCGNEEFILTEETGVYTMIMIPLAIPIFISIIGLAMAIIPGLTYFPGCEIIMSIGTIILIIGIIATIAIYSFNTYKKNKLRELEWVKTSRTKATCTNCYKQYYVNSQTELYTNFPFINK